MDFAGNGLLDGLEGDNRVAREELLALLAADGYTLVELTKAVQENRLALPADRVLGDNHTAREIEQRTGLLAATMIRIRRLHGLPEPNPEARVFSDEDVEAARSATLLLDAGLEEEQIIEIFRVLGEGMARLSGWPTESPRVPPASAIQPSSNSESPSSPVHIRTQRIIATLLSVSTLSEMVFLDKPESLAPEWLRSHQPNRLICVATRAQRCGVDGRGARTTETAIPPPRLRSSLRVAGAECSSELQAPWVVPAATWCRGHRSGRAGRGPRAPL